MASPYHPGEQWVQEVVGVRARSEAVGSAFIRGEMPAQHQDFFGLLPWLLVATVDPDGQPHASVVVGAPGFVRAPDATHLVIAARPLPADPLERTLRAGADVGILGLEPGTRRRNRANGRVVEVGDSFTVQVEQSFGNCPKYIVPRPVAYAPGPVGREIVRLERLGAAITRRLEEADTFFLASARPREGGFDVDMSHRGGPPGFLRVEGDTLTFADFAGNNFFNSLGNLHVHPRAGLLFVDRATGDRLHITSDAEIVWAEASRQVRVHVREVTIVSGPLPLDLSAPIP